MLDGVSGLDGSDECERCQSFVKASYNMYQNSMQIILRVYYEAVSSAWLWHAEEIALGSGLWTIG